jgi:hypothetical protein
MLLIRTPGITETLSCKTVTPTGGVDLVYLVHPGGRIQLKK